MDRRCRRSDGRTTKLQCQPQTVTTTSPSVSFSNPTTGSLSGWYKTAFVKTRASGDRNRLEVYSDVERLPGHSRSRTVCTT